MKIKTLFLLTFCCIAVFTACNFDKKTPQNDKFEKARHIYAEAMKVHDEVMIEMSEASSLIKKLKESKDSLLMESDSVKLIDIDNAISQLQLANKKMFSWMENVQSVPNLESDESEIIQRNVVKDTANIIKIQTAQKDKIVGLEEQMKASIENAQKLLE